MEQRFCLLARFGILASIQFAFLQETVGADASASGPQAGVAANQKDAIRFESTSDPAFAVQSRFTGTAFVTESNIELRIASGVLSYPTRGKEGDWRHIEEYGVSLTGPSGNSWRQFSHSRRVAVQRDLMFGKEITLLATNLTIPLENISSRTNHWLVFSIRHVSERHPEGGYTFSHSQRDLFTNLAQTTTESRPLNELRPASSKARFIQSNWTHFPLVSFLKPTNGNQTAFQRFKVSQQVVGQFQERHYSGVRFTAPEWMDGDLEFAWVHLYRSERDLKSRPGYSWGMSAETGEFYGMGEVERIVFNGLPETQARYPFTEKGYMGQARRQAFVPGKTYVLWWAHSWNWEGGVAPDLEFALTILSDRGREEFGEITWP